MKKFAIVLTTVAALGATACQSGGGNNSTANNTAAETNEAVDVNGAAIGASVENGLESASNWAGNAGESIENGLSTAGNAIENTADSAVREVREATSEGGNAVRTETNTSR